MSPGNRLKFQSVSRRHFLQHSALAFSTGAALLHTFLQTTSAAKTTSQTVEQVRFKSNLQERLERGRVILEAQDGGIMLQSRDGRIWTILAEDITERKKTEEKFTPYSQRQLADHLSGELGDRFTSLEYGPLVICTNTSKNYAEWCGKLFLRLERSFERFWKRDDLPLKEPEFPLPICLFRTRQQYANYALSDADAATAAAFGYYSLKTNRTSMFDITSDERGATRNQAELNRRMEKSLGNVATMVHEATHQFAFNGGLHQRYADNPLWLMEGMAMFFEVPDLKSRTGWASTGKPNKARVAVFADWYKSGQRPADSLKSMVRDDTRFLDPESAGTAYAEAWGLTFFLINRRRDEYTAYLKHISEKPMLKYLTPAERIAEFEKFFGNDWDQLDEDMVSLLRRIRR